MVVEIKFLRSNGEKIPALGYGTWQVKGETCSEGVRSALDIGYRHIDTAQAYGNEKMVGKGIKESEADRKDIWLTTKVWRSNLNSEDLKKSVEQSLRRLKTDYVDLLLIHWPFPEIDLENVIKEMEELVDEGKVRNIGVSNFNTRQMERAAELSDKPLLTNQVEYHPFLQQKEVLEKCKELDMMLTAYSPLCRGDVVGNEKLEEIGEKYGKTAAQVTLRWLVQQEGVCAIPKASSKDHREQNFNIFDFQLSEKEMEEINSMGRNGRKVDPSFAPEWD